MGALGGCLRRRRPARLKPVGCFLALSTSALSQRDPQVHKAARDTYEFILDLFTSALQEARELGEIRADVNVDDAALAMLTAMQGIEFLRKSGIDDEAGDRAKRSTVATLTAAFAPAPG
jgi:TetR/AcrR family transcriptional regulator, transcriptional repressor for nem operon